jgi:hypothetical protein
MWQYKDVEFGLVTGCIGLLQFVFTIHSGLISHTVQFSIHARSLLGKLVLSSPLVPASN